MKKHSIPGLLLDETKTAQGVTSDYALAKLLEIPSSRICDYYKGRRVPDEFAYLGRAICRTGIIPRPIEKDTAVTEPKSLLRRSAQRCC